MLVKDPVGMLSCSEEINDVVYSSGEFPEKSIEKGGVTVLKPGQSNSSLELLSHPFRLEIYNTLLTPGRAILCDQVKDHNIFRSRGRLYVIDNHRDRFTAQC